MLFSVVGYLAFGSWYETPALPDTDWSMPGGRRSGDAGRGKVTVAASDQPARAV